MGVFSSSVMLGLFVDLYRKAERKKSITEQDIHIAFAFF